MNIPAALENLFTTFSTIYTQSHTRLHENTPTTLTDIREQAFRTFQKKRFPHPKTEAYRYTPFLHQLNTYFTQKANLTTSPIIHNLVPQTLQKTNAYHILFHNGKIIPNLALPQLTPKKLHILSFAQAYQQYPSIINQHLTKLALTHQDSFIALNTMLFDQGTFIYLPPGTKLDKPLIIHHLTQAEAHTTSHPRLLLVLGQHSKLSVIETFGTFGKNHIFMNRIAEIILEPHAKLNYYHLQPKNLSPTLQMHYTHIHQKASSTLCHHTFTLDGKLVRNHLEITLAQPQSTAQLYGLYTGHSANYIENNTIIHHQAPYTTSNQLYKGIAQNTTTAVFRGSIHVHKPAQKTLADQHHHAWLLDPKANVKAQPRLSIQADDVQCTHGATISQPDQNQLFYLSTRGINQTTAHNMLLQGFCNPIINKVNLCPLKEYLNQALDKILIHDTA